MTITNLSALNALAQLRSLSTEMNAASKALATGKRIADASDGPRGWAMAAQASSSRDTLMQVSDIMSTGRALLDVSQAGLDAVRTSMEDVRGLLVSARQSGVDRAAIQVEIAGILTDIQSQTNTAQLNGESILSVDSSAAGYNANYDIVANFASAGGATSTSVLTINKANVALIDPGGGTAAGILDQDRTVGGTTENVLGINIAALTDSAADQTTLNETIAIVTEAIDETITAQSLVGTTLNRANSQADFLTAIINAKDQAIATLVNANMEEEAARLTALQTQQALSIEALSISNSSLTSVLSLFR